ncbi:MAG: hypothetical protein IT258_13445 [Saprospiraceae bacterium]|nr:hypothetical protein [Saprospiraceae bacterium]
MTHRKLPICLTLFLVIQQFIVTAQPAKWKPVPGTLTTAWTEKVNPMNPLPEYPRPDMFRQDWSNLNGLWNLKLVETGSGKPVKQGEILVPYPVESALSGCGWRVEPTQTLVYSKKIFVPERWKGQRVLLHFGACDWYTQVSINGQKIGEHKGGYDAFVFDITGHVTFGQDAMLTVQVNDPSDSGPQAVGKQHLNPNGIWYTPTSGIWQTVWLEPVPQTFIKSYRVETQPDKERAIVRVMTEGEMDGLKVVARVRHEGQIVTEAVGKTGAPLMIFIKNGRLWTPEDPYLYDLELQLEDSKGKLVDKVRGYFGMRKISVAKDEKGVQRLMLNNKPVFQLGPLDQGFWPDGLYTPPTEEAMLHDLKTLKSLGFNMIRKHVKVELARWYYHCDKMGFLVWQDMPSGNPVTEEDKTQFRWEMKAMIDQLGNHPSIVMWVPFNEGWGQHDTPDYVQKIKEWDPTRLVNNASGWTDAGVGDVLDIHDYPGPSTPKPTDGRVAVLGEFGGLGLNVAGHQWANTGWGYQLIDSPEALLQRYEDLYRDMWPMVQGHGLSAAVYTQVSDVETENNGLMTYDRKVLKMDSSLVLLAHRGQMPPKPVGKASIFIKNTTIELAAAKQGATIEYAIETGKGPLVWVAYNAPIPIKNTTAIVCRASWPDGAKSREQRYLIEKAKPIKPGGKGGKAAGLSAKIYDGSWDKLPDFASLKPANELKVSGISLSEINAKEDFGVVFEGWVEVPETGVYAIHLPSDDGSRLYMDGQKLLEMDGLHGMVDRPVFAALKAGKHSLKVEFFQKKGGLGLDFWLEDAAGKKINPVFGH